MLHFMNQPPFQILLSLKYKEMYSETDWNDARQNTFKKILRGRLFQQED